MGNVLRVAIVDPNDTDREEIKTRLLGLDSVWLEAECSRYEFFRDVVDQTDPDVAVVAIDADPEKALSLIEEMRHTAACSVLVISSTNDGSLILRAMRSGAKEFLTRPVSIEDLVGALDRIGNERSGGASGRSRGCKSVAIAGCSGGVGSTSVAVNLGCALATKEGNTVALIDLDMALGDADVFLDMIPDYTLVDVAQNISRLDFALLKRSMTKHSSGLYLLPRPVQLQDAPIVAGEDLRRVIGLLKATFTHVIIDLSKSYGPLDMVALEEAETVLLVTQLDVPCLRNVVRLLMSFDEVAGLKEKTHIVVNRVGLDAGQIGLKKAQETISRDVFWRIPNDYRVMVEVRNNGVPLFERFPKSNLTQSMEGLAAAVGGGTADVDDQSDGAEEAKDKAGVGRWLNLWPPKSK